MATLPIDFSSPAAGFDQPLALWSACHGRVQRMTRLLLRVSEHLRSSGMDKDSRAAAKTVRRYFDEAAPHHHEDEEKDLFPRLTAHAAQLGSESRSLLEAIATLQQDHQRLGEIWQSLRRSLLQIEAGEAILLDPLQVTQFFDGYQAHMRIEDTVIEAAMKRLLSESDLAQVGRSMAERRGVRWDELSA
jgi:hemerythrin-like domain-containing protein